MRSQAHGRTTPIQRSPPNRSSELPVPPTARLRRHYRTPALHLFLPTFFPACPSDAVEIVALHESVWRLDGLPRHGPGRLAMMGPRSDSECRLQRRGHLRFPHIRPGRDRRARQIPVCASQTTATLSTADPRTRSSLRSSNASLACSRSYSCTRLTTGTRAASRSSSRASWRVELATLRITRS